MYFYKYCFPISLRCAKPKLSVFGTNVATFNYQGNIACRKWFLYTPGGKTLDRPKEQKTYIQKKLSDHQFYDNEKNLLEKYLVHPVAYVPQNDFPNFKRMKSIIDQNINVMSGELLTADHEHILFQQMNYARYRISRIRSIILRKYRWPKSKLHELLNWHQFQQEARSRIVTANMGLVLTMAKHCNFPRVEFADLASEGSMALLRATEKFDVSRGFKFSTYACRVIYRSFYRTIKQYYRYHNKFPVQWDAVMERDRYLEQTREENHQNGVDEVRTIMSRNLADLSQVEQFVVKMRFSFYDTQQSSMTLKEVGSRLGFSKERIRQIQNKALSKLRIAAEDRMVMSTTGS